MRKTFLAGVAALALASSANATTTLTPSYSAGAGLPSYTTAAIFEGFDRAPGNRSLYNPATQGNPASPYAETVAGNVRVYNSTVPGVAVDPTTANGNYLAVGGGGSFLVNLGTAGVQFFSFAFGSLDSYNSLKLTYSDGSSQTFNGVQIANGGVPANGATSSSGRVSFNAGGGAGITSALFTSGQNAFEIDSLAAAAPEPGTWALMILGFGAVGSQLRSRRRNGTLAAV